MDGFVNILVGGGTCRRFGEQSRRDGLADSFARGTPNDVAYSSSSVAQSAVCKQSKHAASPCCINARSEKMTLVAAYDA